MGTIREIRTASVEQFLDALNPCRLAATAGASVGSQLYFRGQANAAWQLLPRAWRSRDEDRDARTIVDAFVERLGDERELQIHDGARRVAEAHRLAERDLLQCFAHEVERAGEAVPGGNPMQSLTLDGNRPRDWPEPGHPVTALASHFGVPTRLVEVSFNPLSAAGFAAWDLAPTASLALYIIRAEMFGGQVTVHPYERASNRYLRAQDACALVVANPELWYERHGRWPTLADVLPDGAITRLVLPGRHQRELAEALDLFGISPATARPSYAGASDAVRRRVELGLLQDLES